MDRSQLNFCEGENMHVFGSKNLLKISDFRPFKEYLGWAVSCLKKKMSADERTSLRTTHRL